MGAGGSTKYIKGKLIATVIALPPNAEQNRIVYKVNELMSLCDQLEQQSLTSLDAHQQLVETLLATLTDSQTKKNSLKTGHESISISTRCLPPKRASMH